MPIQGGCVTVPAQGCNTPSSRWVPSLLELKDFKTHEGSGYGENPTAYKLVLQTAHAENELQPWNKITLTEHAPHISAG